MTHNNIILENEFRSFVFQMFHLVILKKKGGGGRGGFTIITLIKNLHP